MDLSKNQLGLTYDVADHRAMKRHETRCLGGHAALAAYMAHEAGFHEGAYGSKLKVKRNPYPPGTRHDLWDSGFRQGCEARAMGRLGSTWR